MFILILTLSNLVLIAPSEACVCRRSSFGFSIFFTLTSMSISDVFSFFPQGATFSEVQGKLSVRAWAARRADVCFRFVIYRAIFENIVRMYVDLFFMQKMDAVAPRISDAFKN